MKLICECGQIVAQGDIGKGKRHIAFIMNDKPKGELHKNGSNNPEKWTCICSKCQSEKNKKKKNEN